MKFGSHAGVAIALISLVVSAIAEPTNNASRAVSISWSDDTPTNKPVIAWEAIAYHNATATRRTNIVALVKAEISQNSIGALELKLAGGEVALEMSPQVLTPGDGKLTFAYTLLPLAIYQGIAEEMWKHFHLLPGPGIGWVEVTLYEKPLPDDKDKRNPLSNTIRRAFEVKTAQ